MESILAWSSAGCWFDPASIDNFSAELYLVTANTHNAYSCPHTSLKLSLDGLPKDDSGLHVFKMHVKRSFSAAIKYGRLVRGKKILEKISIAVKKFSFGYIK